MVKHKLEGSYTIELSLLTPFIIAVFLLLFFMAYYTHDRIVIERCSYVSVLRASLCPVEDLREAIAYKTFEDESNNRLLAKWDFEKNISANSNSVSINVKGIMKMQEGLLQKMISGKLFFYETDSIAYVCNNTKSLRENTKGM